MEVGGGTCCVDKLQRLERTIEENAVVLSGSCFPESFSEGPP